MAIILKIVAAGLAGVMIGLLVTIYTLDSDSHGVLSGPWRGAPRDGSLDIDPYSLASIARSGLLPLGAAEGLSFVAQTDSGGAPLRAACDYAVGGAMPAARFWTLSLLTAEGFPVANAANRYGFTSAEILRQDQAPLAISVSSEARDGNWLPIGRTTRFVLALHLFDTGLSAAGTRLAAAAMPTISQIACR